MKKIKNQLGVALIEIVVYVGVFAMLVGVISTNLARARHVVSVSTTVDTLLVDLKEQQVKAMSGDTEGRTDHDDYGIYFETDRYTLFHGANYSAEDDANFVINLGSDLQFTNVTFPGATIVFDSYSGEVANFTPGSNTLTIVNPQTQDQKTVTINRFGVITSIN